MEELTYTITFVTAQKYIEQYPGVLDLVKELFSDMSDEITYQIKEIVKLVPESKLTYKDILHNFRKYYYWEIFKSALKETISINNENNNMLLNMKKNLSDTTLTDALYGDIMLQSFKEIFVSACMKHQLSGDYYVERLEKVSELCKSS